MTKKLFLKNMEKVHQIMEVSNYERYSCLRIDEVLGDRACSIYIEFVKSFLNEDDFLLQPYQEGRRELRILLLGFFTEEMLSTRKYKSL